MLPSHNCIIIDSMFSFQGALWISSFQETQWSSNFLKLQSIPWWRVPGSNRWPPACKAGALPAELTPHMGSSFVQKWWAKMDSLSCGKATAVTTCHRHVVKSRLSSHFVSNTLLTLEVVGQNGLEPSTSRLSVVCSSQLSYWPILDFSSLPGTSFPVPSKLNNTFLPFTLSCTDLRTVQVKSSFHLKSP